MTYRQNWQGGRTGFISLLAEGARKYGDEGCDGIEHVYYAGFELPEFDSAGARNWKFHPGNMVARPTYKPVTSIDAGANALAVAAHGFATDTAVEVFSQGGALPAELAEGTTYFAINDGTNSVKLAATAGGSEIDLSSAGTGSIFIFANANVGFNDPVQGNSFFFPGLRWCGAGIAWIEVLLPAELSDGANEPSRLKVIMRGKRVRDYTRAGTSLVAGDYFYTTNNALILLDIYTIDLNRPLSRFHAQSWIDLFKPRCDGVIEWAGGSVGTAPPAWQAVLNFDTNEQGGLRKSSADAWDAQASSIAFPAGTKIKARIKAGPGTFGIGFSTSSTGGPTPDDLIFAIQANKLTNALTQKGSGVVEVVSSWGTGDALVIEIEDDGAGELRFTASRNGNVLPLVTVPAVPNATLYVNFVAQHSGAGCDSAEITPAGTAAAPRQIKRFTGHIAFPSLAQANEAAMQVWLRAPGCGFQDVSGVIKVYETPDRTPFDKMLIYDPNSATKSNVLDFSVAPRHPADKFNFFPYVFRNEDDPLLIKGPPVQIDRPLLRKRFGLKEQPVINLVVMTQSLCERMAECFARLDADLEPFYTVDASFDMHGLAKEDFCYVAEVTAGLSEAEPVLAMVIEERYKFDGVETKQFILQAINPDFYSDTAHGPISALLPSRSISSFSPPPAVASFVLSQPYSAETFLISGLVVFTPFNRQIARVYWKRPGAVDYEPTEIVLQPDTNLIASFTISGVGYGTHAFRIVTQTVTGVPSLSFVEGSTDVRSAQPTDDVEVQDASGDLFIQCVIHPRAIELPAGAAAEVWVSEDRDDPDNDKKRTLPMPLGGGHAVPLIATSYGAGGAIQNNLYCPADTAASSAVSVESLTSTYTKFEFNIRWIGPDGGCVIPISFTKFILASFSGALARAPSGGEETAWRDALQAAYDIDQAALLVEARSLLDDLFTSAEYLTLARTDAEFVSDLYRAYLDRASEALGLAYHLNRLALGATRDDVRDDEVGSTGFAFSPEFLLRVTTLSPAEVPIRSAIVALQTRANTDPVGGKFTPDLSVSPVSIEWQEGTQPYTIREIVRSFGVIIAEGKALGMDVNRDIDPGFCPTENPTSSGRSGPRYKIELSGTEYRVYSNDVKLAVVSNPSAGYPYPLRLAIEIRDEPSGKMAIENIIAGGALLPTTIYSVANQIADFGIGAGPNGSQTTYYLRLYQTSPLPGTQGIPLDVVVNT